MMMSQQGGIGVGIPSSVYLAPYQRSSFIQEAKPVSESAKEDKPSRIRRMNIPRTTLIDRKTG
jgi:hypothetical protein